jgi:hypothetical protein
MDLQEKTDAPSKHMAHSPTGTPTQEGPHHGEWTSVNQDYSVALSAPLHIAHDILNIPMHHSPADLWLALTPLLGISDLDIILMVLTPFWRGTIDSGLLSAIQELTGSYQSHSAYTL